MQNIDATLPPELNPWIPHHHLKFLQWSFGLGPEKLNLTQRYCVLKVYLFMIIYDIIHMDQYIAYFDHFIKLYSCVGVLFSPLSFSLSL
jgi:hypothetical protein